MESWAMESRIYLWATGCIRVPYFLLKNKAGMQAMTMHTNGVRQIRRFGTGLYSLHYTALVCGYQRLNFSPTVVNKHCKICARDFIGIRYIDLWSGKTALCFSGKCKPLQSFSMVKNCVLLSYSTPRYADITLRVAEGVVVVVVQN